MDSQYYHYVELVKARLQNDKFDLNEAQEVEGRKIDLLAYKLFFSLSRINYRAVCQVAYSQNVESAASIRMFSNLMYEFAKNYRKPIGTYTLRCFPVIVAQSFPEEAKAFVQNFNGRHFEFGRWYTEHPVLAELQTSKIFHCQVVGVSGAFPQKGTIDAARKYFSFSEVKSDQL